MEHKLSEADNKYLSDEQKQQVQALKEAWTKAHAAGDQSAMHRANQQAEAIRRQAGYAGGSDGSGYTKLNAMGKPANLQTAGRSASEVQQWVDNYEYLNYSTQKGWVNGYSTDMNLRSMANYIRQQMEANSKAWAGADAEGRAYLHDQNQQLARILQDASGGARSTFNEQLGRWETDNANLGYGFDVGGGYEDRDFQKKFYGMTDEQIDAYQRDTDRYRNFVDQRIVRNWSDESSGFTGRYAQFVNGPYGQLLTGTNGVPRSTYIDLIGDDFNEGDDAPVYDAEGNVVAQPPALKNNNIMSDYTRQFASWVDENGVIQPGVLVKSHPGGGPKQTTEQHSSSFGSSDHSGHGGFGEGTLDKWKDQIGQQIIGQRDHAVDLAVQQLLEAQKNAQSRYQTQRDQISRDERNALDNAALYAEARGDRGGIGHAQYNQIQAAAAGNRQIVNAAQAQLSADTARQMAQLRAEGEFQKADDLLEISQTYLLKLLELEKWAAEYQLDQRKFQASVQQWQMEFALKAAKLLL